MPDTLALLKLVHESSLNGYPSGPIARPLLVMS